ncbi:MAG: class I SAM-dependent methyltransferase [Acidimicrobiia bacterium]
MDKPPFDADILRYYSESFDEDQRIRSGIGELELIRTREIVKRYLPAEPSRVLDVGGASGVHAAWLLDCGHSVDVIDPVPRHVRQANDRLSSRRGFSGRVGDGRALEAEDSSYDVVLLLGPLYHLPEPDDRDRVWSEAARVCRAGGVVVASIISRFASLFSGLAEDAIWDPAFRTMMERDLADGQHRPPEGSEYFTTAYFHRPDEARTEARAAGLVVDAVLGVEGIAAWIPRLLRSWDDPERRQIIINAARAIESEPTLLGLGPHILVVAHKPASMAD